MSFLHPPDYLIGFLNALIMRNSIVHLLPREWATLSPPEQTGLLKLFSKYGVATELTDMVSHEPRKLFKQCVLNEDGWLRLWNDLCANSAVALLPRDKVRFIFRGLLARNRQAPEQLHARRSAAVQARWTGWHYSYALRSVGPLSSEKVVHPLGLEGSAMATLVPP